MLTLLIRQDRYKKTKMKCLDENSRGSCGEIINCEKKKSLSNIFARYRQMGEPTEIMISRKRELSPIIKFHV